MEQKKNNVFMPLLLNNIKAKKNWFFLSTVILFVTTMLIPFILRMNKESFIFFGIVELFVLVFVNCLVDNSFLHNDSKLAYYKSKPATFKEQISVNIIVNIVFTAFLLLLIVLSVVLQGIDYEILESFKVIIPWLLAGMFLASLSSILSGNTLVAGAMTLFNFALPGIIYLIIQFMFSILENLVVGFSARVLMDYFVSSFYKLEYIYFTEYAVKSVDLVYILLLGIILVGITLLIFKMLKRRRNENTGDFIVFNGYKYFVSVLACLIVPALFSVISNGRNIGSEIIVSLLMAALTYYIIIAVIEKSFRISRLSLKVFVASMAFFVALTGGTVAIANQYKNVVPDPEDVMMAYVGNNTWIYNNINRYIENKGAISEDGILEIQNMYNVILFSDKENIKIITQLHKELLSDQNYDSENFYLRDIVIVYYMNDGSSIIRNYKINNSSGSIEKKNEIASSLLNSHEFKANKYYYLYDEKYYSNNDYTISVRLEHDERGRNITPVDININDIRTYLIKDIDKEYSKPKDAFMALANYNYDMPYKEYKEMGYYLEITVRDNKVRLSESNEITKEYVNEVEISKSREAITKEYTYTYTIQIEEGFENTKKYLNIK